MNLENSVIYDEETFPNCFTVQAMDFNGEFCTVWEISEYKDERQSLLEWAHMLRQNQTFMIGFNNLGFDYPILHFLYDHPHATVEQIYEFAMSIINSNNRFAHMVWASDRLAPQIDLFKLHHFDNKAKRTSLKALEINMRSPNVEDMPLPLGIRLTREQIDNDLIPYGINDAKETKRFAHISRNAIEFRLNLVDQFGIDVLNYSDSKIGEQMMIKKLGNDLCYRRDEYNRRQVRQTIRTRVALADVIFPYIYFESKEFNDVLDYLKQQTLTVNELKALEFGQTPTVETKGIFKGLKAVHDGVDVCFGAGGLHGSRENLRIESTDQYIIMDIDVEGMYPSIAIVNHLYPEHLGEAFVGTYKTVPEERKYWKEKKGKKSPEANSLKLAANSVYGNSNNKYSVFFDTLYTMKTTINGQLMLCMLIERLSKVPTLQLIQANTDGITYYIDKQYEPIAWEACRQWEQYTLLKLENVQYKRMWLRDVNNYIAEDMDGNLKLKGAYWYPEPSNYENDINGQQPPAWHKDLSALVVIRAAVLHMTKGVDIESYIRMCCDPFDFMYRIKMTKGARLYLDNTPQKKTSRYFVSNQGGNLYKISQPTGKLGAFKRKAGVSKEYYEQVMNANNWQWCEEVCTKNRSVYSETKASIQAGQRVTMCNKVEDFDFGNVNYDWYVRQAKKLVV